MNSLQSTGDKPAPLVRVYEVAGLERGFVGVTIENGRLAVASGRYIVRLSLDRGRVIDRLETWPSPGGLAFDGRYLWQHSARGLQQLDVRTGFVVRSVAPALDAVRGLACFEGDLLVLHDAGRRITRIRVEPHALHSDAIAVSEADTPQPLRGLTCIGAEVWSSLDGTLVRIDPMTARVTGGFPLSSSANVYDLAADDMGRFWCASGHDGSVRAFARPDWGGQDELSRSPGPPSDRVVDVSDGPPPVVAEVMTPALVAGPVFRRILVPIDFSAGSRRALSTALLLQDGFRSEIHLFHMAEQGQNAEFLAGTGASVDRSDLAREAEARLRRFVDDVFPGRSNGAFVHALVGTDVVAAIENEASRIGATLVILCNGSKQKLFRTHVERAVRAVVGCDVLVLQSPSS